MLSKLLPWDFIQKFPKTIDQNRKGMTFFLVTEPYLERVLLKQLPKDESNFSLYSGNEFTREFIEEHFINYSFFTEKDHLIIMNAENIPASSLEFLIAEQLDWSERFLLLFFTKSSKLFTTLAKNEKVQAIELESPRFWEGAKMWQFCQKVRGVNYPSDVSRFALENLDHNLEAFFNLVDTLITNFPDGKINLIKLEELVARERFDFFELIDLFHKNPKFFFQEILKKETNYDWIRTLCSFMQSHLLKILFPEEIKVKAKLSKYDQNILDMSAKLNRLQLKYFMNLFSELEIQSKAHDILLVNRLRIESLK